MQQERVTVQWKFLTDMLLHAELRSALRIQDQHICIIASTPRKPSKLLHLDAFVL